MTYAYIGWYVAGRATAIVMTIPVMLVASLLAFSVAGHAGNGDEIHPRKYFGSYLFDDGVRVSGGRFDEAGEQLLLYMDTENDRRGQPLQREGEGFVPAFGLPGPERVTFSEDGDTMHWLLPSGTALNARRVVQPEFLDAVFSNGEVQLKGTLYLPEEREAPLPAIVLAHGSGPVSRYAGTWVTFFLEQGFAVLSYDKRGVGESGGDWKTSSYLDLAGDLGAAVSWLARQPMIDDEHIGVHTSSQSGWYGPRTALNNDRISFLVQRAAPAVPIHIGTAHEIREELRAEGLAPDVIEPAVAFWLELHEMARDGAGVERANEHLRRARSQSWFPPAFGDWDEISQGWYERHAANMQLDPATDVARLDIPVLWFLAERDENVPYAASRDALKDARRGNGQLEVVTVHGAEHSFLVRSADGSIRYTSEYWPAMATWLRATVGDRSAD